MFRSPTTRITMVGPYSTTWRGSLVALLGGLYLLNALLCETTVSWATSSNQLECPTAQACFLEVKEDVAGNRGLTASRIHLPEAVTILRRAVTLDPQSLWAKRSALLAGVLLRDQDSAQALAFLKDREVDVPILEDYVQFWRAEALLSHGDAGEAATLFARIAQTPDSLLRHRATLKSGEAWYQADRCEKAMHGLKQAASINHTVLSTRAPTVLLKLADCQLRTSKTNDGLRTLEQVWAAYPLTSEAKEAGARLNARVQGGVWLPSPTLLYDRVDTLVELAQYQEAITDLHTLLNVAPDFASRDGARYKLGLALARLRRYEEARPVLQALVDEKSSQSGNAMVWLAKISLRQGGKNHLQKFPEFFRDFMLSKAQKAEILFYLGIWFEDHRQYDSAVSAYQKSFEMAPGGRKRIRSLWRIGWIQYRTGSYRQAVATFQQGVDHDTQVGTTPRFLYWQARALERLQDPAAEQVDEWLCRRYRLTFYGQRVEHCPRPGHAAPPPPSRDPLGEHSPRTQIRSSLSTNLHYRKAMELKLLGLHQEAAEELVWLRKHRVRSWAGLLELSVQLKEVQAYDEALRVAKNFFKETLEGTKKAISPDLWNVAYPLGYFQTIQTHAGTEVDPYLVASIIREESLFDDHALSQAGAIGLMQLMPETARRMLNGGRDLDRVREQLFDAGVNIQLGVQYLKGLLKQYRGNIMYAVAAYNAGPLVVNGWVKKRSGEEPIVFVELIPYRETRGYVKRVLRSYREYHRLQNGGCTASSLDRVC